MGWLNKILKRNQEDLPVPQYFNPVSDDYEVVEGSNGAAKFQLAGDVVENGRVKVDVNGATVNATLGDLKAAVLPDIILQDAADVAGNGTPFTVAAFKTLTLSITGTSTSRTIVFEVDDVDGNYTSILGVRSHDYFTDTQTTGINEKWTFDITGHTTFRASISAVVGGNVTVKGTAVS